MTQVNIDIRNIASETHPDDRVVIYSVANRNADGTIISTAVEEVELVDGQAQVDLVPDSAVAVRFECLGVADTTEKPGYVPTEGPVSLSDVILKWTPALIDQGILAMLAATEHALGQVSGAVDAAIFGHLDAIARGNGSKRLTSADIEEYDTLNPGMYSADANFLRGIGLEGADAGMFFRTWRNISGTGITDFVYWVLGGKVHQFWRTRNTSGWAEWLSIVDGDTLATERTRTIPNGADWDTITTDGPHRRTSTSHTGINMPTTTLGTLMVHDPQHSSGQVSQTYFGTGGGGLWHRERTSNRWTEWTRLNQPPVVVDEAGRMHAGEARRAVIVETGKRRRGGVVGTAGLPSVALRFDHNLQQFGDKVLPLLEKYRLPWMQAINVGRMGSGNDTWTTVKLAVECHRTGGEVWNHGHSHATFTDEAGADREITEGLAQLRAALPSLVIDGWAPHGSSPQMGYENAATPEAIWGTYPGQLILAQHAFIRTYLPGTHELMTGPRLIGSGHSTVDADTTGAAIRGLKAAMARGAAITFMLHPVYLDMDGYMTTAQFEALLAEIAARRDAGELRVLSCTGVMLADKARPDDVNLLGALAVADATGTEVVNARSYLVTTGVPHEAEVWVSGTGVVSLTVTVDSPSYPLTVVHEITLTGDVPQRLSVVLTPPLDTTGISVALTGEVRHDGVKFRPI